MSIIHKMSSITPLSELDIFGVPPTQTSVEQNILSEHRPISTLDSSNPIEFNIYSGFDEYIRLDKTWFYIKIRVNLEKPMNVSVVSDDWKKVSPVNNFMNSLFKQIDFKIGDRIITQSHQTYAYKTDFETKLGISKDAKESFLTSGLWYTDEENNLEGINTKRRQFIEPFSNTDDKSKGRILDLMGRINLPLFEQNKALLGGCNISLKFLPNDPSFYMMCEQSVRVKSVEFIDASIFINRSKISRPVLEGHFKGLEISNAKYQLRENFVIPLTVGEGIMDTIIDNVHNGQFPKRAFVAFVDHNAFNGSYTLNPFNYKNFDLNHIAFHLNGIQYPEKAYTPDFENKLYVREFLSLFEATNQDRLDSCINIDRENFIKGNNIFAFNFSSDLSSGCCATGHVNPIKHGAVRLQVRFKRPLPNPITILVYFEYDTLLEINHERNPIYEFN